jgi:hypothetical protein
VGFRLLKAREPYNVSPTDALRVLEPSLLGPLRGLVDG